MTLTGKIFAMLNVLAIAAFLPLVIAVYATHKAWREKVVLMEQRVVENTRANTDLRNTIERKKNALALERAAARYTKANLTTRLAFDESLLTKRQTEFVILEASEKEAATAFETTSRTINGYDGSFKELEQAIKAAEESHRVSDGKLLASKDELFKIRDDVIARMDQRLALIGEVNKVKTILEKQHGLSEVSELRKVAPRAAGLVKAVRGERVEISLGADDGLAIGHVLTVIRNKRLVGRLEVQHLKPDIAVASVIADYKQDDVKIGDIVVPVRPKAE